MSFPQFLGNLLGQENVESIDSIEPSLAAPWARGSGAAWVLFGVVALVLVSLVFYSRCQTQGRRRVRLALGVCRGVLLAILFLMLADPILTLKFTSHPRPLLWVLFDGTESMAIEDELSPSDHTKLAEATGLDENAVEIGRSPGDPRDKITPARIAWVKALVARREGSLLERLQEKFRLRAFTFDRAEGVRPLDAKRGTSDELDTDRLAEALTATGQVTAIGRAFEDLALRHATSTLAGVIVISDFGQNAGVAPVGTPQSPINRLGKPIYTIGIGPEVAHDLAVELQSPLVMKKGETESLLATLRQSGFEGQRVTVKLAARRLTAGAETAEGESIAIGSKQVDLSGPTVAESFTFTPQETGRFRFTAEVEPLAGEVVKLNNAAMRETSIRDDFLRLMYVENEPSWEWRFIKEVFHRDKLVGLRGFRTFLRSADPKVRQTNELFLPTLTPKRSDFFANDVIFLGDMQAQHLSPRFCEMTMEFVGKFGGGLVVIAGPRFGPGQLAHTPLADMLPVVVDPDGRIRSQQEFQLQLTAESLQFDFMRLGGESEAENRKAWSNLGKLPWYQPVLRKHPQAAVLAEHPSDVCADGKTRQPLIAIRPYGKGEVVYIGFNEIWRLRRKYGEQYYRQFWGQLIHRLGLSHAIGAQKRFVVRTDRQQYHADERVTVTVEAYNANFEPLAANKLPGGEKRLAGELFLRSSGDGSNRTQPISITELREGVFEARIPVTVGGEHRLRVKDPITGETVEETFQVTSVSAERRSAVRNVALENEIVQASGGNRYDLLTAHRLPDEIDVPEHVEVTIKHFSLASTWLAFGLVVFLMLFEWSARKLINLP